MPEWATECDIGTHLSLPGDSKHVSKIFYI